MKTPEEYATKLSLARTTGTFCEAIEEALSVAQAYSIQSACNQTAAKDDTLIGYKIGATSQETLNMLGLDEPFFGPIHKSALATNNGHNEQLILPLFLQHNSRVEAEFVVCLKEDIMRGSKDVVIEDILSSIDWVAPGIEVVASRFDKPAERPGSAAIADFGANQYMVIGEPYKAWTELNLNEHPVTLEIDSEPTINGHSGMSIFGNPLAFVCWLLNQPAFHETGLQAGQIVSCGTCTGAPFVTDGNNLIADYGPLGRLSVRITAKSAP